MTSGFGSPVGGDRTCVRFVVWPTLQLHALTYTYATFIQAFIRLDRLSTHPGYTCPLCSCEWPLMSAKLIACRWSRALFPLVEIREVPPPTHPHLCRAPSKPLLDSYVLYIFLCVFFFS
ncbi:hypothetical protein, unlikely [Trypanosoma brucei gambiense DAL972]|uniref:Uncharacterized protein n=1 Tax=Trypanosoma brucei gambiense (strain MHOM/CI/86/DAL972) TaxID=679716 RepID=D0A1M2_TRYB9|nr:hypothetical protein, unlikely [Trypanosoma brucei gambiense DAL972]CBH15164.1 hypothetical protein, unlikely [Trypanosoma brucei gambiense DAL972]|eukprot:XP_011777430.1 hypothetical protein, unlikely [Trypanosoma brucei gambiense DAL972]